MKEIISEPNYSPAAPDEHAQSIARHIPDAELWIPENTSHSVHHERHEEWISRVLGFLKKHVQ
jgi:pimeloyl-ACP methyl ester carboxylesterase